MSQIVLQNSIWRALSIEKERGDEEREEGNRELKLENFNTKG